MAVSMAMASADKKAKAVTNVEPKASEEKAAVKTAAKPRAKK